MVVYCTYCGQSFTRDEHLERHILTHTNVKPFKCFTCHMSFARRDLLQRHYMVHGRNENNEAGITQTSIPRTAGRTPIACTNCAKTKTKCDKKFPCSRCASRNLQCTPRPTRRVSRQLNRIPTIGDDENSSASSPENSGQGAVQTATPEESKRNSPAPQPLPSEQNTTVAQCLTSQQPQQSQQSQQPTPEASHPISHPDSRKGSIDHTDPVYNSPSSGASQILPAVLSPLPTPASIISSSFMPTPISLPAYDGDGSDHNTAASPRFMMDWTQLPYSTAPQFSDFSMNPLGLHIAADNPMLPMMPEFHPFISQAPLPDVDMNTSCLSELDLGASGSHLPSTRSTSISDPFMGDLHAVVTAQDAWNCFRCGQTVLSSQCPRTAKLHLEKLEQSLKNHEGWKNWSLALNNTDRSNDYLTVVPLKDSSKDKLLAITQTFLHKALDIHKDQNSITGAASSPSSSSNFVLLPPVHVLDYFLRAHANSFERYYPMTSKGTLDMNERLMNFQINDRASSLLTLMMIASGSLSVPSMDARWLQGGLTEACRISLFNLVETNIALASDHTVLHSALLFTTAAAWGGDKWHMDIASGQRGMYTAMLRHSGALEHRQRVPPTSSGNPDELWHDWLEQEGKSRLIYSWAMVDQDLSFFRDIAPLFSVTEFGAPMPDADRLWHAKSAMEWSTIFNQVHDFKNGLSSVGSGARPLSLRDLFGHFLSDDVVSRGIELTPLHLRLLLLPLQSMVWQFRELSRCFTDTSSTIGSANTSRTNSVTADSTRERLDEVQTLLQRWLFLADRYTAVHPLCPMMQASMVMFHLISLNAVSNFPEIERFARKEGLDGSYEQLMWMYKRCIAQKEEAVFHAGQVLKLLKQMASNVRPPWWPGALYRAALVLWTEALSRSDTLQQFPVAGSAVAVDVADAHDPLVVAYRTEREGVPVLTKRDGAQVPVQNSFTVLTHCIDILDEGVANRFSDGIRNKLDKLARSG